MGIDKTYVVQRTTLLLMVLELDDTPANRELIQNTIIAAMARQAMLVQQAIRAELAARHAMSDLEADTVAMDGPGPGEVLH